MKLTTRKLQTGSQFIPSSSAVTEFRTICRGQGRSRRGVLTVNGNSIETPVLFPVLNLLTGPPPLTRNGATHKFLKKQLIINDRRAGFMSEALHFRDYPFSPRTFREWFPHTAGAPDVKTLDYWVRETFRVEEQSERIYKPLFFLDSGGFRMLFNREIDIAEFGYEATPQSILQLQLDYGADIVASLDFPIPPNLIDYEAQERIERSIENAVSLMRMIYMDKKADQTGKQPFPYLAVHGQTPAQIRNCLLQLLMRLDAEGFTNAPFGIGIGSLVPLRLSNNADRIVMLVRSVVETLYGQDVPGWLDPSRIPVHTFGITGDMIPVLSYLGVDSFDSSSYIKSASALSYYDPVTWTAKNFRSMTELVCDCSACRDISLENLKLMQKVLEGEKITGNRERLNHKIGQFTVDIKSDVYGIIAYHNLILQDREIYRVRDAIDAGEMSQHLVQFSQVHRRAEDLVAFVAGFDDDVANAIDHVQLKLIPKTIGEIEEPFNTISLYHDPEAFNIVQKTYQVPENKDRLLLLACSKAKPYRLSSTHQGIYRFLQEQVEDRLEFCHKVTISGLYGPVPLDFEDDEQILSYEYVLSSRAMEQKRLLVDRLVTYLRKYLPHYRRVVAYVTAVAYRNVIEEAFSILLSDLQFMESTGNPTFLILPTATHGTGSKELHRKRNLFELVEKLFPDSSHFVDA